jgi:hypothetical protein
MACRQIELSSETARLSSGYGSAEGEVAGCSKQFDTAQWVRLKFAPSVAEAAIDFLVLTVRLKPHPFKAHPS